MSRALLVRRFLILVGGMGLVMAPGSVHAQLLKLSGYADLEWSLRETNDPEDEWNNFFDNHHFNLIGVAWVTDDLSGAFEVEYEHAGGEIGFEYGYISYVGIPYLRLVAGKFILPFNRYNKDLHPTFISKMSGRPPVYGNVFPSTYSDVGLWASGGAPLGQTANRVTYDLYVVNGLKGDPDETNFRDLRETPDPDEPDSDDNKAVGGRLGVELANAGFGVSGYTGDYAKTEDTGASLGISFIGVDADYHWQGLELRGEFVSASQDLTSGESNDRSGYYLQAAYLTEFEVEPVIRFTAVDFEEPEADTQQLGIGFNYYLSPSGVVRVGYFFGLEDSEFEVDNDMFVTQFVVVF
jgi:hypothetical protein